MKLNLETINFQKFEALENFINSLTQMRFGQFEFISTVNVSMEKTDDPNVPWLAEIEVLPHNGAPLFAVARSSNTLTAFSQSVMRMQRQVEKYNGSDFRSRA